MCRKTSTHTVGAGGTHDEATAAAIAALHLLLHQQHHLLCFLLSNAKELHMQSHLCEWDLVFLDIIWDKRSWTRFTLLYASDRVSKGTALTQ